MRLSLPRLASRHARFVIAITIALVLAATHVIAQFGTFQSAFEGELWGVRHEVTLPAGGYPSGVAYVNGTLFVADPGQATIRAYDSTGAVVALAGADWADTSNPLSPAYGLLPNQLFAATVDVNGAATAALLVSDSTSHRVFAFDATGSHLFTMRLDRPQASAVAGYITGVAMGPASRFVLTTGATPTLQVNGSFAAGWTNQYESDGVVLAFKNIPSVLYNPADGRFEPTPTIVLTGQEGNNLAPAPQLPYGVVFDADGNLYTIDTNTERLNVYDGNFGYRFTFGTPAPDGSVEDFNQPYAMAFSGDRLMVADSGNHRLVAYRPDVANQTLDVLFTITGLGDGAPKAVGADPLTGRLAASDLDQAAARVWVFETPNLAAFDVQVQDGGGIPTETVCLGANYRVQFSLTVPANRAAVSTIVPVLTINGVAVTATPALGGAYPDAPLQAGQVATYTYSLSMPANDPIGDFVVEAGATASTTDVLFRQGTLSVADCSGQTPTISATPSIAPQVSGWTAVLPGNTLAITLTAADDVGVERIEYQLSGQNDPGVAIAPVTYTAPWETSKVFVLLLPEFGPTTLRFRARDNNNRKSAWQELDFRIVKVEDVQSNEGSTVSFAVGHPIGTGYTFSATGLPPGVTISAGTGLISGAFLDFDESGVYPVTVTETLGAATSSVSFEWVVLHINRPPVILQPVGAVAVDEAPFTLQITGSDPDGDQSFFTMYGRSVPLGYDLPPTIVIDPVTGLITGTFGVDSQLEYVITVGLSECSSPADSPACTAVVAGERLATLVNFTASVSRANMPPLVISPGPLTNAEGNVMNLLIAASDPDNDTLTYRALNLPLGLSMNEATGVISGTISHDSLRSYVVTLEVNDGRVTHTSAVTYTWNITDVNQSPTVSSPNRTSNEGESVTVPISANDPDGTPLTFSMAGLPSTHSINPATGVISGTFGYEAASVYTVTVTVTDGPAPVSTTFTWTVLNINRYPVLNVVDRFNTEGQTVAVAIDGTDPDGDALVFSMNGLPAGFSIDPATGVISGTFSYESAGVYTVNVGVVDAAVGLVRTFLWTVAEGNRAPVVDALPDRNNAENETVSVAVTATDADGNALTYGALGLPPGLGINPLTGLITGTLSYNSAGTHTVQVLVSDGTATTTRTFTWTVRDINRPPTASAIDRTNAENDTVSFTITSADPDGDVLSFTASGLPAGISINPTTGVISGTLGYTTAGSYPVSVTVSDGSLSATAPFTWTVTNTNAPPVVTNPGPRTNAEGESVSVAIVASDVDGQALNYTASGLPPGLVIDGSTGVVTGSLGYDTAGTYTVTVSVSDGVSSPSVTFTWTVTNVNRPPVVVNPGNQTSAEGAVVVLPISASDPDLQALTYSATGLPPGLSIDPATGVITGTLGYAASGAYTVTVSASDGSLSDSKSFTWTVANTNRPPTAVADFATVVQGQSTAITVLANDTDLDGVSSLSVVSVTTPTSGTAVRNTNGTITYTANATFTGVATFSYTISDGLLTSTATVTVNVTPSNRPPVCSAAFTGTDLWPPNHREVYVTISGVTDPDGGTPTIRFTSILQDEPTNSVGQGHTMQDGGIENNGVRAWVRAERSGTKKVPGDGRVYLIGFTATDASGASCTGTVRLDVPHDQRGTPAVLSPGRWNSITGQHVSSAPSAPVANDDTMASTGSPSTLTVLSNDVSNGQALTVTVVTQPSKGQAMVNSNGSITYTPPSGDWTGTTTFTYQVRTPTGITDTAVVTVTVTRQSHDDDDNDHDNDHDDDDCGDRNHDHGRDTDSRDRDHRRGDHDRCTHRR